MNNQNLSFFFLGLGVGLAAGMIFAPLSGEETRTVLRSRAGEGSGYLKRRSDELKRASAEVVDRGRAALQRQKEQVDAAIDAGRQAYRETVQSPAAAVSPRPTESL